MSNQGDDMGVLDGRFSVKSAFELLQPTQFGPVDRF